MYYVNVNLECMYICMYALMNEGMYCMYVLYVCTILRESRGQVR